MTGGDGQILDHSRTSNLGATYGATLRVMAGVEGTIGGGMPVYFRATDHVTEAHDRAPGQGAESPDRMMGDLGPTYGATRNLGATTNPLTGVVVSLDIGAPAYVRADQNSGWTNGLVLGHCRATDSQRVIYDERYGRTTSDPEYRIQQETTSAARNVNPLGKESLVTPVGGSDTASRSETRVKQEVSGGNGQGNIRQGQHAPTQKVVGKKDPLFDGKSSWLDYLVQFEMVAKLNQWSEMKKALELATSLSGQAREIRTEPVLSHW